MSCPIKHRVFPISTTGKGVPFWPGIKLPAVLWCICSASRNFADFYTGRQCSSPAIESGHVVFPSRMLPRPGTKSVVSAILLRHSDSPPTGTVLYLPTPPLCQLSISELFQNYFRTVSLVNPTQAHSSPRSHDKLRNSPLLVLSCDTDIQSPCDSHIQEVNGLGKKTDSPPHGHSEGWPKYF
jgi:hypothetical protein